METQSTSPKLWVDREVVMPGMGPGANKAGWWVAYLQELQTLGQYDVMLHFLNLARRSGALETICQAKKEQNRLYVEGREERKRSGEFRLPGVHKITLDEKREPYYYEVEERSCA